MIGYSCLGIVIFLGSVLGKFNFIFVMVVMRVVCEFWELFVISL